MRRHFRTIVLVLVATGLLFGGATQIQKAQAQTCRTKICAG